MTQPTFALPCEYGLEVSRKVYGAQTFKLATTSGTASPSGEEIYTSSYDITTAPIDNNTATALDRELRRLKGSFFFSQFYFDDQTYKYRIVDDTWQWKVIGPTANTFTLSVERVYEPEVEFGIDYGLSQSQTVSTHLIRISTTIGDATPAAQSRPLKTAQIRTWPMSKAAAASLEASLVGLNGSPFYSQLYLDTAPRLYRLSPYEWQWTPANEDGYVCEFSVTEVLPNALDIPLREQLGIDRTSRIKKAQFGDGYEQVAPDGINTELVVYSIETLPLSDTQAASLNSTLLSRKGDFFYSKFKDETAVAKYRIDDNRWSWNIQGKDANVFQFRMRKVYDL
jgi:phage-related protein